MNKAGGFSEFVELLFRWETDKRGKRIRRIIADCAELKEAEVGYRSEGGWGAGTARWPGKASCSFRCSLTGRRGPGSGTGPGPAEGAERSHKVEGSVGLSGEHRGTKRPGPRRAVSESKEVTIYSE